MLLLLVVVVVGWVLFVVSLIKSLKKGQPLIGDLIVENECVLSCLLLVSKHFEHKSKSLQELHLNLKPITGEASQPSQTIPKCLTSFPSFEQQLLLLLLFLEQQSLKFSLNWFNKGPKFVERFSKRNLGSKLIPLKILLPLLLFCCDCCCCFGITLICKGPSVG